MPRQLIVVLALLVSASAVAAPAKKPAPVYDQKQEKVARAHFDRAEKAFNLERFEEALAGYQAAYEALPLPAFLFNIAQCHRNLHHREQAVFFYQRYLSLAPDAPNRRVVEDLIAEQQKPPPAAPTTADDQPAPPVDLSVRPEAPPPVARVADRPPPPRKDTWKTTRWWLAGAVGAGIVAGIAIFAMRPAAPLPSASLGIIDTRRN